MTEAERVVQRQLDAYNAQDLDAFCACYGDDVVLEDGSGEATLRGIDALRRRYGELFAAHPGNRASLARRIALGDWVIDEEHIDGRGGVPLRAIAIFHVTHGLIDRVRFLAA